MHDIKSLKQFLGSDEKFIATLMDKFMEEMPKEAQKLKDSVTEKNWDSVRAMSHKMLSSVKIFDAKELTPILQNIEIYSEDKVRLNQIPGLVTKFETSCEKTLKKMKKLREGLK